MKNKEKHLEEVTTEALVEFRNDEDSFIAYASSTSSLGRIQIGVNLKGVYVTKAGIDKPFEHKNVAQAIQEYKRLIEYGEF